MDEPGRPGRVSRRDTRSRLRQRDAGRRAAPSATLLERRAVDYVMFDLGWVGGLSEAQKIAALAEAHTGRSRRTTAPVRSC